MSKSSRVILLSIVVSLLILSSIIFAYEKGYLFKLKWEGDYPYDEYYCYVYDIYPKYGQGIKDNLPPEYLSCYIDTNAPPDHVFVKFEWNDDVGWHRSGRIWLARWNNFDGEATQVDNDTYYVKFFIGNFTSASNFVLYSYYQWKVEVYYCDNPTTGAGIGMWDLDKYYKFYTDDRPPLNSPPVADANGPYMANVGETIQLDGSNSVPTEAVGANAVICEYIWDIYNDGTWDVVGVKPRVRFNVAGLYEVRLRVVNSYGLYDDDITYVTVTQVNNPPVADADGPYEGLVNEVIQLDGSGSYDPDNNPLSYEWDVDGDGIYDLQGKIVNVTYIVAGTYNVVLKVSDGQYSDTDTTTVTVSSPPPPPPSNQPPVAEADGPYEGFVNSSIVLDGSGSYDPDGIIVEYKWDIDNDGLWDLYGMQVNVTFLNAGEFTVKLQVTDDDGATSEDTASVVIHDNPSPPPPPPEEEKEKNRNYLLFGAIALLLLIPVGIIAWRDRNERRKF